MEGLGDPLLQDVRLGLAGMGRGEKDERAAERVQREQPPRSCNRWPALVPRNKLKQWLSKDDERCHMPEPAKSPDLCLCFPLLLVGILMSAPPVERTVAEHLCLESDCRS